ncbi:MAG: lipoprotein-releasing ABC transporter permease subunit [Succinivibrionaceae bacterium]
MFRPLFLSIGINYSLSSGSHRFASFIAILSMLGIMLGVAALIVVVSIMNGLEGELKDRVLSSFSHAIVTTNDNVISADYDISHFKLDSNVLAISPLVTDDIMIQGKKGLTLTKLQGINPSLYPVADLIKSSTGSEAFDYLVPNSYEIIIGSSLAKELGVNIGDKVRLISVSNVRYTPFGRVPAQRLFTVSSIFYIGVQDGEQANVIANIEDVKRLLKMDSKYISGFRVWLEDPFKIDDFKKNVASYDINLSVKDWREEKGDFFQSVAMEKLMMSLMLALIIMVAIFNMLSALVMVVTSKLQEIAILRTMGMSRLEIMGIFIVEGAISGIVGSLLGVIMGLLLIYNIDSVLSWLGLNLYLSAGGFGIPYEVEILQVLIIVCITILFSFGITIYPSLKAAYMNPVQTLRCE